MSLQLLIKYDPDRTLALVQGSCALLFRSVSYQQSVEVEASSRCQVEFTDTFEATAFDTLRSGIYGTLGLVNIGPDLFLCLICNSVRVAAIRPNETVERILAVDFHCINSSHYDFEQAATRSTYQSAHSDGLDHSGELAYEHPCTELRKMLNDGTFYYSFNFDLTNRLQDRFSETSAFDLDAFDDEFLWNKYLVDPLIKFRLRLGPYEKRRLDALHILTSAIRGFVSTLTQPQTKYNSPALLTLISRLSCRRAGTRFNSRGIDDGGNVANFVETETVLWKPPGICFSYAQVRGSVPLFWEQSPGLLPGQHKIQLTRSAEATQSAFDRHFQRLQSDYGAVSILNLLSELKVGEAELIAMYKHHVQHSTVAQLIQMGTPSDGRRLDMRFDFHAESKAGNNEALSALRRLVGATARSFAYFRCTEYPENSSQDNSSAVKEVILQQEGIFRTNCLDCLDRTNLVQTLLSQMSLEHCLQNEGEKQNTIPDLWMKHSTLWADNGDALSKIYAGTGAIKSSLTRNGRMNLAGALADARKSATRLYVNNFVDKGKQNTIDMLLGRLIEQAPVHLDDPVADYVEHELKRREDEFSVSDNISIWIGTFNLNGRRIRAADDLSLWLHTQSDLVDTLPELVVVGFQEMVELSPQQIMSTDPQRRREWEQAVKQTLNRQSPDYVLLRSGQLVGAALMVFVRASILARIRNVEGSEKKTGMSGIAGNKGAVAIRMEYSNTSLCFITAHMAAGFANIEERNRDYQTINRGLKFQRNRSIEDHDVILWAGDFNYRIGLGDARVRQLITDRELQTLYANDQLNLQMMAGRAFQYYSEPHLEFNPTYKYDNFTDNYDTSEKARIPAWCDRILFRGRGLHNRVYTTGPLRFSDHRPVFATFGCRVNVIDEVRKEALRQHLLKGRRKAVSNNFSASDQDESDDDFTEHDSIDPGLPPPSSDIRKWWLDDGLPVKSIVKRAREEDTTGKLHNPFIDSRASVWQNGGLSTNVNSLARKPAPFIPQKPDSLGGSTSKIPPTTSPSVDLLDATTDDPAIGSIPALLQ